MRLSARPEVGLGEQVTSQFLMHLGVWAKSALCAADIECSPLSANVWLSPGEVDVDLTCVPNGDRAPCSWAFTSTSLGAGAMSS